MLEKMKQLDITVVRATVLNCFWILILLSSFQSTTSQSLQISSQDLSVAIDETKNFSISLDESLSDEVYIFFKYDSSVIDLSLPTFTIPANSTPNTQYVFTVHPNGAGKTTIFAFANTTSEVNISTTNSFIRVSVYHLYSLEVISTIVGWIYFVAWSVSFYPQTYINFKRKSVAGLNFDFVGLNITGFLAYSFFNVGLYFSPIVQAEYLSTNPTGIIPVELNDVFFGLHASFATILQIIQCFIYARDGQTISKTARAILALVWTGGIVFLIVTWTGANSYQPWLTLLYYFSYCKLGITIIKYIPQAYFNFRRKSTEGWSIGNILLDFTGGSLSMLQMFVIAYNFDDWQSLFGNPTKFGLGFFSILFDILFMVQHYCLYNGRNRELDPLCNSTL